MAKSKRKNYEEYIFFKTVVYLVAGFLSLFITTCSGGCAVTGVASGEVSDYKYIVWTIVFGVVTVILLRGFSESRSVVEKYMKGEEDEETESK